MAEATKFYGPGGRKTSVARVWLRPGAGAITVNPRAFENYFPRETLRMIICQPLQIANLLGQGGCWGIGGSGRPRGSGRRRPARDRAGTPGVRRQAAAAAEEGRPPHPRSADAGEEEVRPARRPAGIPVFEALAPRLDGG